MSILFKNPHINAFSLLNKNKTLYPTEKVKLSEEIIYMNFKELQNWYER